MNPPLLADAGAAAPEPERPLSPDAAALLARTDEEIEKGVAEFGTWYESQPAEWIAEMDAIGRMGARAKP